MKYWKYIVISLLAGIMAFHLGALFYIRHQNYELTSPDYYQKELQHEQTLERLRRGQKYQWRLVIAQERTACYLEVLDQSDQPLKVKDLILKWYRPNNSLEDQHFRPIRNDNGHYIFDLSTLGSGRWDWEASCQWQDQPMMYKERTSLP